MPACHRHASSPIPSQPLRCGSCSADADFSCFADLALTSPVDYYREGQGSLMQVRGQRQAAARRQPASGGGAGNVEGRSSSRGSSGCGGGSAAGHSLIASTRQSNRSVPGARRPCCQACEQS